MSNRFLLEMNIRKYLRWILLVLFRKVRKLLQMDGKEAVDHTTDDNPRAPGRQTIIMIILTY